MSSSGLSGHGPRFERQVCLREIGPGGQARIEGGELVLGSHLDDLGVLVARRYARGAGMMREVRGAGAVPDALSVFRHSTARSVAAGALAALAAINGTLRA
jgi:hypothetical protein